jgi:hypothetical protein
LDALYLSLSVIQEFPRSLLQLPLELGLQVMTLGVATSAQCDQVFVAFLTKVPVIHVMKIDPIRGAAGFAMSAIAREVRRFPLSPLGRHVVAVHSAAVALFELVAHHFGDQG